MIYVVVGEESDYDYHVHKSFFASSSKEKAEKKKLQIEAQAVIVRTAAQEFHAWVQNDNPYNKFRVELPKDLFNRKRKLVADHENPVFIKYREECEVAQTKTREYVEAQMAVIAQNHNLTPEEVLSRLDELTFSIEEVPSDDDD